MTDTDKDLRRFFDELLFRKKIYDQYKAHNDKFLSSDFNLFSYLNTAENDLSDYLGMILDVTGPHGQKDLFLNLFINYLRDLGLNIEQQNYKVEREYWADGRVDIYLHNNNTAIIIENKPWATDQDKQLERYYKYICSIKLSNVYVLYLSPGSDPAQTSMDPELLRNLKAENKFRTIPLINLAEEFLTKAYHQCESLKFRFFIADFIQFLQDQFKSVEE